MIFRKSKYSYEPCSDNMKNRQNAIMAVDDTTCVADDGVTALMGDNLDYTRHFTHQDDDSNTASTHTNSVPIEPLDVMSERSIFDGQNKKKKSKSASKSAESTKQKLTKSARTASAPLAATTALFGSRVTAPASSLSSPTLGRYCLDQYIEHAEFFEEHVVDCVNILIDIIFVYLKHRYQYAGTISKTIAITYTTIHRLVNDIIARSVRQHCVGGDFCSKHLNLSDYETILMSADQIRWMRLFLSHDNIRTVSAAVCASPRWAKQELRCKSPATKIESTIHTIQPSTHDLLIFNDSDKRDTETPQITEAATIQPSPMATHFHRHINLHAPEVIFCFVSLNVL